VLSKVKMRLDQVKPGVGALGDWATEEEWGTCVDILDEVY